jgi:hypothetical protein
VVTKETKGPSLYEYYAAILTNLEKSRPSNTTYNYYACDINDDGNKELLIEGYTCEADRAMCVVSLYNGELMVSDDIVTSHCSIIDRNGYMYISFAQMSSWGIKKLTLQNGEIKTTTVAEGYDETGDYAQLLSYGKDFVEFIPIQDFSQLWEAFYK